jgi:hypothetical protein
MSVSQKQTQFEQTSAGEISMNRKINYEPYPDDIGTAEDVRRSGLYRPADIEDSDIDEDGDEEE